MARNRYTEEQKAAVVARASEIGISGAAKETGIDRSTVSRWIKAAAQAGDEVKASEEAAKEPVKTVKEEPKKAVGEKTEKAESEKTAKTCKICEAVNDAGKDDAETEDTKGVFQEKMGEAVAAAQVEIKKAAAKAGKAVMDTTEKVRKTVKKTAVKSVRKARAARVEMFFETNDGRQITPETIAEKIPKGAESAYIKLEENRIYWVKGEETGSVEIW